MVRAEHKLIFTHSMQPGDGKLVALAFGNFSLSGFTLTIQKVLPFLSFVLVVLQIVAALYTVWHIFKKRKNAKVPPPDPDI